jgi:hypothetical protein
MVEMTQRQMLRKIVEDVDEVKIRQETMEKKLDNIEIDLGGTRLEPGRGVVQRLVQAEKCISEIKKKQFKIFTWVAVITVGLNTLYIGIKTLLTLGK